MVVGEVAEGGVEGNRAMGIQAVGWATENGGGGRRAWSRSWSESWSGSFGVGAGAGAVWAGSWSWGSVGWSWSSVGNGEGAVGWGRFRDKGGGGRGARCQVSGGETDRC